MAAAETLRVLSSDAGWVPDEQVKLLMQFIDEIGAGRMLDLFLKDRVQAEIAAVKCHTAGPFVKFEFDASYFGGNYSGVGQFRYVPEKLCDAMGYERAFQLHTSIDPRHIIHYIQDELYDSEGNPLKE